MGTQNVNIPKLGIFLGLLAALAAGLLSVVKASTSDAIAANQQKKTSAALEKILPAFDSVEKMEKSIESKEGWPVEFYVATKAKKVVGFAGKIVTPKGFSGDITLMVGLNPDASIRTVIVTENTETPGLGTVIANRKFTKTIGDILSGKKPPEGLPPNPYLDQYAKKKAGDAEWKVNKDGGEVDAKTGATITSRAVCGAVYAIAKTAADHLDELSKGAK